jgi:hypothetical protein
MRQIVKYLSQILADIPKHHLTPVFRNPYYVILAIPTAVA